MVFPIPRLSEHSIRFVCLIGLIVADLLALVMAVELALTLRFDYPTDPQVLHYYSHHSHSLLISLVIYIGLFGAFRLYRYAWRFASLEMLWGVVVANSCGVLALVLLQSILDRPFFPDSRAVLILIWLLGIMFVGGLRITLRLVNMALHHRRKILEAMRNDTRPTRAVILGAGSDGARVLSMLREEMGYPFDVIGFLDDSPQKQGIYIRGVRVIGPLRTLYSLLAKSAVDEVMIAMPGSGMSIREYVMACRKLHVPVKVIPDVHEALNGKSTRLRLEDISVEDLLRRPPISIDLSEVRGYLKGKTVLVTGAGGSIGSELCRQIIAMNPKKLILFGHGENSLHQIHQELTQKYPALTECIDIIVGSIADAQRVDQVFRRFTPQIVVHAAAHKHVPIMELNVSEAVKNNVRGSYTIAEACGRFNVKYMVLISTDKAVYPSSVMGATKWLCEEVVRRFAHEFRNTVYVTVRFGNVLGSRGSVVPIFRDQIKRGGPITITHPEMTRYFMTIPEAVQLVLQAGAIGKSGVAYLLDMGKPVKILDLATDMIRLCGLEPEKDIPIQFTGLRPGEKLYEKLATDDEVIKPSACEAISIVQRPEYFTPAAFDELLQRLLAFANAGETEEIRAIFADIIPLQTERSERTCLPQSVAADASQLTVAHSS